MANETPSYTPAQLQEAEKLVNNFLEGRNDQLGDSRDAALTLAAAMRRSNGRPGRIHRARVVLASFWGLDRHSPRCCPTALRSVLFARVALGASGQGIVRRMVHATC
jgi:hypothetical protein